MYKFVVTFRTKPGRRPAMVEAMRPLIAATRQEPGCVSYDLYASLDDDDVFVMVECFRSKQDHVAHEATPHFLAVKPAFGENVLNATLETINVADGGSG